MPRKTFLLLIILLFSYFHAFSQEELFGSHNGISTAYLNGLGGKYSHMSGEGISFSFKNRFIAAVGDIHDTKRHLPFIGFSYYISKAELGFSYTPIYSMFQFNLGTYRILFKEKSFPGVISGGITISLISKDNIDNIKDIPPIIGVSYIQAFFARNRLYPVAGINYTHDFDNNQMFSAVIGLNLRFGMGH